MGVLVTLALPNPNLPNSSIQLIGGAILAGGVYYQLNDTSYYKELVNHDIFNVPIIMMVIGGLLLLVGISGFIGACAEIMILLKLYMGFLIIIMLVQIINTTPPPPIYGIPDHHHVGSDHYRSGMCRHEVFCRDGEY
eukprot:sb/3474529/